MSALKLLAFACVLCCAAPAMAQDGADEPDSLQVRTLYFIGSLLHDPPGSILPKFNTYPQRRVLYEYERMYVGEGDIYDLFIKTDRWQATPGPVVNVPATLPQGYDFTNQPRPGYDLGSDLLLHIFRPYTESDKRIIEVYLHRGGKEGATSRAVLYCIFNEAGELVNYHYAEYTNAMR